MKSIAVKVSVTEDLLKLELPLADLLAGAPATAQSNGGAAAAPRLEAVGDDFELELEPLPGGFEWAWPNARHHYRQAFSGRATWKRRAYDVRLGEVTEDRAGRPRRYVLVMINGYPTLNFVEGEDGRFASIITPPGSRASVRSDADLPPGYVDAGLRLTDYHEVIRGPGASRGRAVVVDSADDHAAMVKHAILRWDGRNVSPLSALAGGDDGEDALEPDVLALLRYLAEHPRETVALDGPSAREILGRPDVARLAEAINRAAERELIDRWSTSGSTRKVAASDANAVVGVRLNRRGAAVVAAPPVI